MVRRIADRRRQRRRAAAAPPPPRSAAPPWPPPRDRARPRRAGSAGRRDSPPRAPPRRSEIFDMLAFGVARGAAWLAIDAGGLHRADELAVARCGRGASKAAQAVIGIDHGTQYRPDRSGAHPAACVQSERVTMRLDVSRRRTGARRRSRPARPACRRNERRIAALGVPCACRRCAPVIRRFASSPSAMKRARCSVRRAQAARRRSWRDQVDAHRGCRARAGVGGACSIT